MRCRCEDQNRPVLAVLELRASCQATARRVEILESQKARTLNTA
jgi:hypothetical protein